MPRSTWMQQHFTESYSKDPNQAAVLLDSLTHRNISDFRYALEVMKCDPNLLDASSGLSVFQTVLQTPKSSQFIKLCIISGADFYKVPTRDSCCGSEINFFLSRQKNASNRYPIHYAIKSMCPENVEIFLKNYDPSKVNLKHSGQNCLHLLVGSMTNANCDDVGRCMKLLLSHGCNPNMPNNALKTPFYLLLKKQVDVRNATGLIDHLLQTCEIDFHTYKSHEIIKMMETIRPDYKIPATGKVADFAFMMTLLDNRKELEFEIYFKAFKELVGENFTDHCLRFLEIAVANGMKDTVEYLLEKRIDVNARSSEAKYLKPPAFLACSNGYFRILELLLKKPELKFDYQQEDNQKYTLLHEICQNFAVKAKENKNVNFQQCFEMVLRDARCDPNAEDDLGCSPLHYTVRYKNDVATIALLKKGAYVNEESNFGKTPIDEISRVTLEKFLDECIMTNATRDKNRQPDIQIDYSFLIAPKRHRENDSADEDGFCKEISALKRISDNEELRSLVNHPVLSSFLFLKWSKLSFLFYTNLALFSIFMAAFIFFIVLCQYLPKAERESNLVYQAFEKISFVSIWMLMLREFFQCILSYKHYFKNLMNWFEIFLILLAWLVYFSISRFESEDRRMLRAVLILCAAFEFLQIVGTLPFLSVSTHMVILKRVSITFLKSIALYSILLLSFGLSFFMLFGENQNGEQVTRTKRSESNDTDCSRMCEDDDNDFKNFKSPGISIVRVFVMLTGEFDATDMKLDSGPICIIFTIFVFLVTIVLFNLLNALAVSDTQAIKAKGEIIDLIQRIQVLDSYEKIIFNRNSRIKSRVGPSLRSFISLFPMTIPNGKIIIRPSRNNEILTFKNTHNLRNQNSSIELEVIRSRSFRKITINEQLLARLQKYSQMSSSIMKKVRNIMAEKEEQKIVEMNESRLREDIASIRNQMDNQLRLINELLSKQKNV